MMKGQSVDYAAIHVAKTGISPYPPYSYIPLKRGRGPPCGEDATIDEEFPCICRSPARE
jgi:hypothetical protein